MPRFQSKEDYARWRATQRGDSPAPQSSEAAAEPGGAPEGDIYDGPSPGSAEFSNRSRAQAGLSTDRDRTLAMLCHLTSLTGFIVPFGNVLGPLVVWMIGKGDSQFVDEHGKSSLNFQLSITLFFIAVVVLGIFLGPLLIVLLVVCGIVALYGVVMAIINGVRAHNGDEGEYALSTRFLK